MGARGLCLAALLLLLLLCWAGPAEGKAAKKTKHPHNREDVPFVRCVVCQEVAKVLARDIKQMKSEKKKVKEIDILDKIEKVCDPDTPHGKWIAHMDVVEDGTKLKLEHHEEEGSCGEECRTISRSCEDTIGYHDTDLAETFFSQDLNRIGLEKLLCRELTNACTKPTPPLPAGRKPGPAFTLKSEKERYLDELTYKMGDMPGQKMSLYSREDMEEEFLRGRGGAGDDDEEEDDEEDEDEMFSSAYRSGAAGGAKAAGAKTKEVGAWEAVSGMVSDVVGGAKKAASGALEWISGVLGGGGGAGKQKKATGATRNKKPTTKAAAGGGGAAGAGGKNKKSEF